MWQTHKHLIQTNSPLLGVFVNQGSDEIRRVMDEARLDYAQLHGHQSVESARAIGMFWGVFNRPPVAI